MAVQRQYFDDVLGCLQLNMYQACINTLGGQGGQAFHTMQLLRHVKEQLIGRWRSLVLAQSWKRGA